MAEEPKRDPPPSRGRGATLLALLKKQQELRSQNVEGAGDAASGSSTTAPSSPPKPRGRAAMLQKLAELKLTRAGSSVDDTASVASVTETMSVKEAAEPCYYEGKFRILFNLGVFEKLFWCRCKRKKDRWCL